MITIYYIGYLAGQFFINNENYYGDMSAWKGVYSTDFENGWIDGMS